MSVQLTKWDVQEGLQTPEDCAAFVEAAIAEAGDDPTFIAAALGEIARSKGMAQVSRDTGISREGLYKALSKDGNPSFGTVLKVLRALGMTVHIEAMSEAA